MLLDVELQNCRNILNTAYSTQHSTKILQDELSALTDYTMTLDGLFSKVQRLFNALLYESDKEDFKKEVESLSKEWKNHSTAFNGILWAGRHFAGDAQAIIDDYAEAVYEIVTDDDTSTEDKEEIILHCIKKIDEKMVATDSIRQMIKEMSHNLKEFIERWRKFIESTNQDGSKTKDLEKEIERLTETLEAIQKKIIDLASKKGTAQGQGSLVLILSTLEPGFVADSLPLLLVEESIYVHGDVLTRDGHRGEVRAMLQGLATKQAAIRSDLNEKRAQRDKSDGVLPASGAVYSILHGQVDYLNEVYNRLLAIASVFRVVRADFESLITMVHATKSGPFAKSLFEARAETLQSLYEALSGSLSKYQNTINPK